MVRDEGNTGMLGLYERERMLIAHQTVDGEARWITHNKSPVRYHVEALSRSR